MVTVFIDGHRERFGVAPICRVLTARGVKIAPETYSARRRRPACARAVRDERVAAAVRGVHEGSRGLYGARKVYQQLRRDGGVDGRPSGRF